MTFQQEISRIINSSEFNYPDSNILKTLKRFGNDIELFVLKFNIEVEKWKQYIIENDYVMEAYEFEKFIDFLKYPEVSVMNIDIRYEDLDFLIKVANDQRTVENNNFRKLVIEIYSYHEFQHKYLYSFGAIKDSVLDGIKKSISE